MELLVQQYGYILLIALGVSELLPLVPQLKANGVVHGSIDVLKRLVALFGLKK